MQILDHWPRSPDADLGSLANEPRCRPWITGQGAQMQILDHWPKSPDADLGSLTKKPVNLGSQKEGHTKNMVKLAFDISDS